MCACNNFQAQIQQLFFWHILKPFEFVMSLAFNIIEVCDFLKRTLRLKTVCADASGISVQNHVDERRSTVAHFAGRASGATSDTRARQLGLFSSKTDLPDGVGMKMAGGHQKAQQEAAALGMSVPDYVGSQRAAATAAASMVSRGTRNPKKGKPHRNAAARVLGEQVGAAVMGQADWALYIITSCKDIKKVDKPLSYPENQTVETARISGERDGWEFVPADVTKPRWSMTDIITYRMPGHTEADPDVRTETLREAISEAYHANWMSHAKMMRAD